MKSHSLHQQPTYSPSGNELRINFNHATVEQETEHGLETYWVCDQALLPLTATREQIVEAINQIDPSQAEELADGWIDQQEETS